MSAEDLLSLGNLESLKLGSIEDDESGPDSPMDQSYEFIEVDDFNDCDKGTNGQLHCYSFNATGDIQVQIDGQNLPAHNENVLENISEHNVEIGEGLLLKVQFWAEKVFNTERNKIDCPFISFKLNKLNHACNIKFRVAMNADTVSSETLRQWLNILEKMLNVVKLSLASNDTLPDECKSDKLQIHHMKNKNYSIVGEQKDIESFLDTILLSQKCINIKDENDKILIHDWWPLSKHEHQIIKTFEIVEDMKKKNQINYAWIRKTDPETEYSIIAVCEKNNVEGFINYFTEKTWKKENKIKCLRYIKNWNFNNTSLAEQYIHSFLEKQLQVHFCVDIQINGEKMLIDVYTDTEQAEEEIGGIVDRIDVQVLPYSKVLKKLVTNDCFVMQKVENDIHVLGEKEKILCLKKNIKPSEERSGSIMTCKMTVPTETWKFLGYFANIETSFKNVKCTYDETNSTLCLNGIKKEVETVCDEINYNMKDIMTEIYCLQSDVILQLDHFKTMYCIVSKAKNKCGCSFNVKEGSEYFFVTSRDNTKALEDLRHQGLIGLYKKEVFSEHTCKDFEETDTFKETTEYENYYFLRKELLSCGMQGYIFAVKGTRINIACLKETNLCDFQIHGFVCFVDGCLNHTNGSIRNLEIAAGQTFQRKIEKLAALQPLKHCEVPCVEANGLCKKILYAVWTKDLNLSTQDSKKELTSFLQKIIFVANKNEVGTLGILSPFSDTELPKQSLAEIFCNGFTEACQNLKGLYLKEIYFFHDNEDLVEEVARCIYTHVHQHL